MLSGTERKFRLDKIEDLEVRVEVIGYKRQGEAIVILFRDKPHNKTFYSVAIDCYSQKYNKSERNLSDDILRKYKVKCLSMLCWTHPHLDHSKGLLKLFHKYCWISTKVIKPDYFDNKDTDVVSIYDEDTKKVVEGVFGLNALKPLKFPDARDTDDVDESKACFDDGCVHNVKLTCGKDVQVVIKR